MLRGCGSEEQVCDCNAKQARVMELTKQLLAAFELPSGDAKEMALAAQAAVACFL